MAGRPRVLIREDLLSQLKQEHEIGVKYSTLTKKHNLSINSQTLADLLSYFDLFTMYTEHELGTTIYSSLFPSWLNELVQLQDAEKFEYVDGKFPFGRWRKK